MTPARTGGWRSIPSMVDAAADRFGSRPALIDGDARWTYAELVERAGGRSWTRERADLHTREALARLDRLAAPPSALADLSEVTRFLLSRTW